MNFQDNQQIKLAYEFVQYTNKNIFLTGKAGTGKTTFLNNLKKITHKRNVVVAPTGVAAINAGGVTIHSFFQLPFSPFIPEEAQKNFENLNQLDYNKFSSANQFKLRKNKIKIIKSLDLLIIDEISMVRADLLDAVDAVLRRYRNSTLPFGGVQLLMIGDLHQLSPVVKDDEWSIVKNVYKTAYFFSSIALRKTDFITVELKKIYRQQDEDFINILGEVRDNKMSNESIQLLNRRVIKNFNPDEKDGYITLTTHNATAQDLNLAKHEKLAGKSKKFKAEIQGDFPEFIFPTSEELELKVSAQVMFIKNDTSFDKLYYNGKIGKITKFQDDVIYVKCPDDYSEIPVTPVVWENIKYQFNDKSKAIEEKVVGSFEQYPLKLAWAITIHKSQGLTFDKAIIDINAAFAFGQVYVALSRCRSLEGLVLMSEFSGYSIKSDYNIEGFTQNTRKNPPNDEVLQNSKIVYQQNLILQNFDFSRIKKTFFYIKKIIKENIAAFDMELFEDFEVIQKNAEEQIYVVNNKFIRQLVSIFKDDIIPENCDILQDRVKKASVYYLEKIQNIYIDSIIKYNFDPDNKDLNNTICDALEKFELELFSKINCLKLSTDGFNSVEYVKCLADSELDFKPKFNKNKKTAESEIYQTNENLYAVLNSWRKSVATDEDIPVYMVLPQKSIKELVSKLPSNIRELKRIKGFGKVKCEKYGTDVLDIINEYCIDNDIDRSIIDFNDEEDYEEISNESKGKKIKIPSHQISYDMFCEGKSLTEIAMARGFVESTIFGHLVRFVKDGKLDPTKLIDKSDYEEIAAIIKNSDTGTGLKDIFEKCNGKFSYDQIRLTLIDIQNKS